MSENPYAPPVQTAVPLPAFVVEPFTSVGRLLSQGFSLYLQNFTTIAAISLVVFAPIELVKNMVLSASDAPLSPVSGARVDVLIEAVFGSWVTAAIIHALAQGIRHGQPLNLSAALEVGGGSWTNVIAARFRAGITILFGLLLLLVPGVIWSVEYALTDEVATLEPQKQSVRSVLYRSKQLVRGKGWRFLGVMVLSLIIGVVPASIAQAVSELFHVWWMSALADCIGDVSMRFSAVTGLLMYLGTAEAEVAASGEASAA